MNTIHNSHHQVTFTLCCFHIPTKGKQITASKIRHTNTYTKLKNLPHAKKDVKFDEKLFSSTINRFFSRYHTTNKIQINE